jgi:uncharacterized protein with WD repeat
MPDYVPQFAWEPHGKRFALLSTNDPNFGQNIPGAVVKFNVDFYQPDPVKTDFTLIKHLEGKSANSLFWSPKGRHIALATIASSAKFDVEFWDLDFTTDDNPNRKEAELGANIQLLGTGEHYGVTDLAWDPSGRYVATHASAWRSSVSVQGDTCFCCSELIAARAGIQNLVIHRCGARRGAARQVQAVPVATATAHAAVQGQPAQGPLGTQRVLAGV